MARGGKRPGAGRKAGSATKKTREIADRAASEGLTPLDYMLSILRDEAQGPLMRFEAAKAAAPYVHPKLASIDNTHKGPDGGAVAHKIEMHIVDPKHAES